MSATTLTPSVQSRHDQVGNDFIARLIALNRQIAADRKAAQMSSHSVQVNTSTTTQQARHE